MNEKTLKLLEFDAIRTSVAALALSEEAGSMLLGEEPRQDREETDKLKSMVSAVTERMTSSGGEKRESLPDIKALIGKLEVAGAVLETDEAYAIGIFIDRAEALRQWLLKPVPPESNGRGFGNLPGEGLLSKAARELPGCAEIASEVFKVLDREGNIRDLPEFRDIRRRIKTLQKDIESTGSRYARDPVTRKARKPGACSSRICLPRGMAAWCWR